MIRTLRTAIAALAIAFVPVGTEAAPTSCPEQFAVGVAPDLANPRLAEKTRELCFQEFAVLHSGLTRTPLYSAEHLTAQQVADARGDERNDAFHEETRLPEDERSELADYRGSGYDRGHLAPSADMPDPESQRESFSMANIMPQAPGNNRGVWANIERTVRNLASDMGEVYVVTGPAFKGANLQGLRGRVLIPTHVWKAVYIPSVGMASAYLTVNADGDAWEEVSIAQLREFVGIDPFPGIPEAVKMQAVDLPDPSPYRGSQANHGLPDMGNGSQEAVDAAVGFLKMLMR